MFLIKCMQRQMLQSGLILYFESKRRRKINDFSIQKCYWSQSEMSGILDPRVLPVRKSAIQLFLKSGHFPKTYLSQSAYTLPVKYFIRYFSLNIFEFLFRFDHYQTQFVEFLIIVTPWVLLEVYSLVECIQNIPHKYLQFPRGLESPTIVKPQHKFVARNMSHTHILWNMKKTGYN